MLQDVQESKVRKARFCSQIGSIHMYLTLMEKKAMGYLGNRNDYVGLERKD